MEIFEPGTRCPFTQHTFKNGEAGRKCLNCGKVLKNSAWQEKQKCFCDSTNFVEAVAAYSTPTQVIISTRVVPCRGNSASSTPNLPLSRPSSTARVSFREASTSNQSSSSSSSSSDSSKIVYLMLAGIIIFILFGFSSCVSNLFRNTPSTSLSTSSKKYPGWNFPRNECGDPNPPGDQKFYPVFINKTDSSVVNHVITYYCKDAYVMIRKKNGKEAIQVASFQNESRAAELVKILIDDSNINSAEVGEKTVN